MSWGGFALLACAVLVLWRFFVFLRLLYREGTMYPDDLRAARGAQLLPLLMTAAVLALEIVLIERFPALTEWIPLIVGVTALAGALVAVQRTRIAILQRRAETGE